MKEMSDLMDAVDKIAEDLEISKYKGTFSQISGFGGRINGRLSSELYNNCVLYSAAAMWIKASLLDDNGNGRSKRYYSEAANNFLNYFYTKNKNSDAWFYRNNSRNITPGLFILNKLIDCGEMCVVKNNGSEEITLFPSKHIGISDSFERVVGMETNYSYDCVLGLSYVSKKSERAEKYALINNDKWVQGYLDNLKDEVPSSIENCSNKEYLLLDGSYSKDVRHVYEDNMPYSCVKVDTEKGSLHYIFYDGKYYDMGTDTFERNYFRFRINLVRKQKKRAIIQKYGNSDNSMILLTVKTPLPKYEDSLLRAVMWPMRDICDKFNYLGPSYLLNYVHDIISELGMDVEIK